MPGTVLNPLAASLIVVDQKTVPLTDTRGKSLAPAHTTVCRTRVFATAINAGSQVKETILDHLAGP